MRTIKKILIEQETGKKYFVKDLNEDFHTSSGVIPSKGLKGKKTIVTTNRNKSFLLIDTNFSDLWDSLKRGPQVMLHKDIGLLIAKTGINKNSLAVDAGAGSGSLCLFLANVCKEVIAYEINPGHYDIAQKNKELCCMENLTIKQADIYEGISEKNVDLITLDVPEPWRAVKHAEKALKPGGHLVVYLPNLHQVKKFIDSAGDTSIKVIETVELLERKWKIVEEIMRPEFQMLGHTGFLTFCRKFS
ncbi:MAG: methyltransferase domain-containing protein [Nanoarchaeota archaeon]